MTVGYKPPSNGITIQFIYELTESLDLDNMDQLSTLSLEYP